MTYREAKNRAAFLLREAGIEQAEAEARLLMEYVCGKDLSFYLLHADEEMPAEQAEICLALTDRRCTHIPLQHLTGEQEFMGLSFRVNADVLIPRPETALLVEAAVRTIEDLSSKDAAERKGPVRVLDLCTGSGCISVALKVFCPDVKVSGSDLSAAALRIAAENARRNEVDVNWIHADLFQRIGEPPRAALAIYDLIICNPPYIPTEAIDHLMPEVRDYDPRMALDGGADGLDFYRRILGECGDHLSPGGRILFEIGFDQGNAVAELMRRHGLTEVEIHHDLAGLDRVVEGML